MCRRLMLDICEGVSDVQGDIPDLHEDVLEGTKGYVKACGIC